MYDVCHLSVEAMHFFSVIYYVLTNNYTHLTRIDDGLVWQECIKPVKVQKSERKVSTFASLLYLAVLIEQ